jgi:hypothetical protein
VEQIIEKAVFVVPHLVVIVPNTIHGVGDPEKMFEKTKCNLLVHGIVVRENKGDLQHALAVEGHPGSAIGLIQIPTCRQGRTPVEDADVVKSEKTASKDILA